MDWLDFSGLGPLLARFRRWLDKAPSREFSELGVWGKLGRLTLIAAVVGLLCMPAVWFFTK